VVVTAKEEETEQHAPGDNVEHLLGRVDRAPLEAKPAELAHADPVRVLAEPAAAAGEAVAAPLALRRERV